jgi:signal transduction histidine kinase
MMTLHRRLTAGYLAVLLLGMGLAAALAWLAVEQLHLETQRANLLAQARLAATALQGAALQPAAPYSQALNTTPGFHTYVLEQQDIAVLDLQAPPAQSDDADARLSPQAAAGGGIPADLLSRPEVEQARAGQAATAVRALPGGKRVLYAAAPVVSGDGSVARIVYVASPLPSTGWGALPETLRWELPGALLLATALAGLAGWWLARGLARPLRRLARAANAVADGDLEQHVPQEAAVTELRDLGRAFNHMTDSLRQADRAKVAFVADVSHELRTPLTVIKGNVETLQDGALDDLEVRDLFLEAIAGETDRLIRLVNDLLVLTRADAGALNLQPEPVDLDGLARARARHFAGLAAAQGVQICVAETPAGGPQPAACPRALADPHRVAQVLDNLLANAVRHTPPGGRVTITVTPGPHEVACAVADTGAGIPAQHLPLIFDRFYRADPARSRGQGGCGLGLSITRALLLAQGGRIAAQSVERQGTTMTFWLPAASTQRPAA